MYLRKLLNFLPTHPLSLNCLAIITMTASSLIVRVYACFHYKCLFSEIQNYVGNYGSLIDLSNFTGITRLSFPLCTLKISRLRHRDQIFSKRLIFAHFPVNWLALILDGNFVDLYFSIFVSSSPFSLLFCTLAKALVSHIWLWRFFVPR